MSSSRPSSASRRTARRSRVLPPIDAHVLTIHPDRNRVLLDKGSRDGVAIGFVFTVYLGSTYKGLVRVTEVDETTSFAEITGQKNPIASGDAATIYL